MDNNRKIKFRGKDEDDKTTWHYGYYTQFEHQKSIGIRNVIVTEDSNYKKVMSILPETIGQFTGQKDKHGNDIYEGDILQCDFCGRHHLVIWENMQSRYEALSELNIGAALPLIIEHYQIIGNIHDNPELFRKEEKHGMDSKR